MYPHRVHPWPGAGGVRSVAHAPDPQRCAACVPPFSSRSPACQVTPACHRCLVALDSALQSGDSRRPCPQAAIRPGWRTPGLRDCRSVHVSRCWAAGTVRTRTPEPREGRGPQTSGRSPARGSLEGCAGGSTQLWGKGLGPRGAGEAGAGGKPRGHAAFPGGQCRRPCARGPAGTVWR